MTPHAAEQYEAAALDLSHQIFADAATRDPFVGCAVKATPDLIGPCVRDFFAKQAAGEVSIGQFLHVGA